MIQKILLLKTKRITYAISINITIIHLISHGIDLFPLNFNWLDNLIAGDEK